MGDPNFRMLTYGAITFGNALIGVTTNKTINGETVTYRYDTSAELMEVEDLTNDIWTDYRYDTAGRLVAWYPASGDTKKLLYKDSINPVG